MTNLSVSLSLKPSIPVQLANLILTLGSFFLLQLNVQPNSQCAHSPDHTVAFLRPLTERSVDDLPTSVPLGPRTTGMKRRPGGHIHDVCRHSRRTIFSVRARLPDGQGMLLEQRIVAYLTELKLEKKEEKIVSAVLSPNLAWKAENRRSLSFSLHFFFFSFLFSFFIDRRAQSFVSGQSESGYPLLDVDGTRP